MGETGKKNISRYVLIAVVAVAVAGLFLALGPPGLLARSSEPGFCASCHVMESQYEAWAHAGAHRRGRCVDCHLPNGNRALHYVWKSIDGLKDVVVFYSGSVPEEIRISGHGEKVLQRNCIRCHESTVAKMDTGRKCWDCHRRLSHKRVGTIEMS